MRCLFIHDVYLRESTVRLADDFDPLAPDLDLGMQFMVATAGYGEYELKAHGVGLKLIRFHVNTGLRLKIISDEDTDSRESKEPEACAEIKATFVAEYIMKCKDFDLDDLKGFGERNVPYHIWPYWREYAQSTCKRFKLPEIMLPMYRVDNADDSEQPDQSVGQEAGVGSAASVSAD